MLQPRSNVKKRQFSGVQVTVTIPKHIAMATGIFSDGFVEFKVSDLGVIEIHPHPSGEISYGNQTDTLKFDRPANESTPG